MKHKPKRDGRSAWNETVREMSNQGKKREKRETRQRRAAATKNRYVVAATTDEELKELRYAARIDDMLGYRENKVTATEEEDDEFLLDDDKNQDRTKVPKRSSYKKKKSPKYSDEDKARELRHRPRPLVQILLEHFGDGHTDGPDWFTSFVPPNLRRPYHKICYVTGRPAKYTDPVTGLHFADRHALNHLREHPPEWVRASAPSSFFHDTLQSIQQARSKKKSSSLLKVDQDLSPPNPPPPKRRRLVKPAGNAVRNTKKRKKKSDNEHLEATTDGAVNPNSINDIEDDHAPVEAPSPAPSFIDQAHEEVPSLPMMFTTTTDNEL
uniref:Vps72/YL1 C-terminal domain-containing protein n=1 Tax=Aureoumbra lagunensis TaxID=44058 RepID=A0A7S3NEZ1_9STRA|mmetsp:Transcript_18909/g.28525  ORF Transcript_18909/g.28525 Transcript_18909/m.28525 type:complete len:324 (+) Transcript_18909:23-994(+)